MNWEPPHTVGQTGDSKYKFQKPNMHPQWGRGNSFVSALPGSMNGKRWPELQKYLQWICADNGLLVRAARSMTSISSVKNTAPTL